MNEFPKDLTVLSAEALESLRVERMAAFEARYKPDFSQLSIAEVDELSTLSGELRTIKAELSRREKLAGISATKDEFAKVEGTFVGETTEDAPADETVEEEPEVAPTLAADIRQDAPAVALATEETVDETPKAIAFATGQGLGVGVGDALDWEGIGKALDARVRQHNVTPYAEANRRNQVIRTVNQFAQFRRELDPETIVKDESRGALQKAIDAARAKGGKHGKALVASGGWGAPSQISYDVFEKLSSQDGIATFPEIGVERGGLQIPTGSSFAEVYASRNFMSFTEEQDKDGEYALGTNPGDPNVAGAKPIYRVPGHEWVDHRLEVDGIQIQAGILEQRGYPEGLAVEVAQVLDAHAHKINAKVLARMVAGSTAVNFTGAFAGAVAPLLAAIDLQVHHYRDLHRMPLDAVLEAKFPHWARGLIRADLALRLGVDLLDVSDARIAGWFADRDVTVEWVYDWQSLATTAVNAFKAWPSTISFSLYAAGTWVKGVSDVISFDTMYDSTLLASNDYTVMFTEEGWFLAKAGPDSRVITVAVNPTGAAHIGAEIDRAGLVVAG